MFERGDVAYWLIEAHGAILRAIEAKRRGQSPILALQQAITQLRLAIKARAWLADDWATFYNVR